MPGGIDGFHLRSGPSGRGARTGLANGIHAGRHEQRRISEAGTCRQAFKPKDAGIFSDLFFKGSQKNRNLFRIYLPPASLETQSLETAIWASANSVPHEAEPATA